MTELGLDLILEQHQALLHQVDETNDLNLTVRVNFERERDERKVRG